MSWKRAVAVFAAALAVVVIACGDDDSDIGTNGSGTRARRSRISRRWPRTRRRCVKWPRRASTPSMATTGVGV